MCKDYVLTDFFSSMASLFGLVPELVTTVKVKSLSHVQLFATPWTIAFQVPPFMGFPRQECWSGLPFPSPEESSQPRYRTLVSCIAGRRFTSEPPGKPQGLAHVIQNSRLQPNPKLLKQKRKKEVLVREMKPGSFGLQVWLHLGAETSLEIHLYPSLDSLSLLSSFLEKIILTSNSAISHQF